MSSRGILTFYAQQWLQTSRLIVVKEEAWSVNVVIVVGTVPRMIRSRWRIYPSKSGLVLEGEGFTLVGKELYNYQNVLYHCFLDTCQKSDLSRKYNTWNQALPLYLSTCVRALRRAPTTYNLQPTLIWFRKKWQNLSKSLPVIQVIMYRKIYRFLEVLFSLISSRGKIRLIRPHNFQVNVNQEKVGSCQSSTHSTQLVMCVSIRQLKSECIFSVGTNYIPVVDAWSRCQKNENSAWDISMALALIKLFWSISFHHKRLLIHNQNKPTKPFSYFVLHSS